MSEAIAIDGAEIFRCGIHRGKEYTRADLEDMARNFAAFSAPQAEKVLLRVPAVFGHEEDQEALERSDMPAAAWPSKVYVDGDILKADFPPLNPAVARLIAGKAYDTVSSEVYDRPPDGVPGSGKMLRRIAFLGGDIPEVKGLKSLSECLVPDVHSEARHLKARPGELTIKRVQALPGGAFAVFSEVRKCAEKKDPPRERKVPVTYKRDVTVDQPDSPLHRQKVNVTGTGVRSASGQPLATVWDGGDASANILEGNLKDEAGQPYGPQTPTKNAEPRNRRAEPRVKKPRVGERVHVDGEGVNRRIKPKMGLGVVRDPNDSEYLPGERQSHVDLPEEGPDNWSTVDDADLKDEAGQSYGPQHPDPSQHAEGERTPRQRRVWGGTNAAAALERRNRESAERGKRANQEAAGAMAAAQAAGQALNADQHAEYFADRPKGAVAQRFDEEEEAPVPAQPYRPQRGDRVRSSSGRTGRVSEVLPGGATAVDYDNGGQWVGRDASHLRDLKNDAAYDHAEDEPTNPILPVVIPKNMQPNSRVGYKPRKPLDIEIGGRPVRPMKTPPPGYKAKDDADRPSESVPWNDDMDPESPTHKVPVYERGTQAIVAAHDETDEELAPDMTPLKPWPSFTPDGTRRNYLSDGSGQPSAITPDEGSRGGSDVSRKVIRQIAESGHARQAQRNAGRKDAEPHAEDDKSKKRKGTGTPSVEAPTVEEPDGATAGGGAPNTAKAAPSADDRKPARKRKSYFAEKPKKATVRRFEEGVKPAVKPTTEPAPAPAAPAPKAVETPAPTPKPAPAQKTSRPQTAERTSKPATGWAKPVASAPPRRAPVDATMDAQPVTDGESVDGDVPTAEIIKDAKLAGPPPLPVGRKTPPPIPGAPARPNTSNLRANFGKALAGERGFHVAGSQKQGSPPPPPPASSGPPPLPAAKKAPPPPIASNTKIPGSKRTVQEVADQVKSGRRLILDDKTPQGQQIAALLKKYDVAYTPGKSKAGRDRFAEGGTPAEYFSEKPKEPTVQQHAEAKPGPGVGHSNTRASNLPRPRNYDVNEAVREQTKHLNHRDANGRLYGPKGYRTDREDEESNGPYYDRSEDVPRTDDDESTDHAEDTMPDTMTADAPQKQEMLEMLADKGMDTSALEGLPEQVLAEILRVLDTTGQQPEEEEQPAEMAPPPMEDDEEQPPMPGAAFGEDEDDDQDEDEKKKRKRDEDEQPEMFSERKLAQMITQAVDAAFAARAAELSTFAEASSGRSKTAIASAKTDAVDRVIERLSLAGRLPPAERESVRQRLLRADSRAAVVKFTERGGKSEMLTEFEAQVRELESRPTLFAERMKMPSRSAESADAETAKIEEHFDSFSERYHKLGQTREKFLGAFVAEKKMRPSLTADEFLNR